MPKKPPYRSQLMHLGGFFPPSATAAAVPLWRFNYLQNYKGPKFVLRPSFFAYFLMEEFSAEAEKLGNILS
ncbi:hypothetical protein LXM94_20420 [Rhizobium sp. TRM95111]|uniref:hypothetical protein n=1 Tax=Rhizobium alarense TaxID=2846851 RepID=UPI001F24CE7B|nr:hypothetical protein [Rhizobium alarense]MCF3642340.1 hypothetical protein [Rhizobium alarense]